MSGQLGDKTFSDLGIRVLRGSNIPILPETRDRILTVPGRHGAYDFGAELGSRLFELECAFVNARTPAELQQAVRTLAQHLMDSSGRPRVLQLRLDIEPDKYYNVRYAGSLPIERIASLGRFTLPLVAYDPFAYGDEQTVPISVSPTVVYLQAAFPVEYSNNQNQVTNAAPILAFPVFEVTFTGAASEFKITHGESGQFVRVVNNFAAGDTMTIDHTRALVLINGANGLSKLDLDSDFFHLQSGRNTISVSPMDVADTMLRYVPRWL